MYGTLMPPNLGGAAVLRDLEAVFDRSRLITKIFWGIGFAALLAGGYLIAGVAGLLIAVGSCSVVAAATEEIKIQIYPIGLAALDHMRETGE
jgi:hypothetical protein